jgi:N-acylmannosamine kinase
MLVAVDTGATKTLVAIFSKDGTVTSSEKFATPADKTEYIHQLTKTIASLSANQPIDAIAVALPGRVKDNVLLSARNLGWKNFDIEKELKQTFSVPILVENDANLAGLGESKELKDPVPVCLYITISTGIGTGIITNGQIDPHFTQSEGGQAVVNYRGRMRRWESFASGKSIYKTYHTFAMNITSTLIWKRIAKDISKGLLVLTPTLRPDIIVIGGSIGTYFEHYGRYLTKELNKYLHYVPPIVAAKRPEEAVIYGCYHYATTHLSRR